MSVAALLQPHDCDLGAWQSIYKCMVIICSFPCRLPQQVYGKAGREGRKLLSPADRTSSCLWRLAEKPLC